MCAPVPLLLLIRFYGPGEQLMEAARWPQGHQSVLGDDLVHSHEEMSDVFRNRFVKFAAQRPDVQADLADDLPAFPERQPHRHERRDRAPPSRRTTVGRLALRTMLAADKVGVLDVPGQPGRLTRLFNACVTP